MYMVSHGPPMPLGRPKGMFLEALMKKIVGGLTVAALLLSSCVTVNNLDEFSFTDAEMNQRVSVPHAPEVHLSRTSIPGSSNDGILQAVEIGANIVTGLKEAEYEQRLYETLDSRLVEAALRDEFVPPSMTLLGAREAMEGARGEYLLEVEVREYGIHSSGGGIYFHLTLEARIHHFASGNLVWRRRISEDYAASPSFFGLNDVISTAITIRTLDTLSDEQLSEGFDRLARNSAYEMSRRLRRDLFKKRS